MKEIRINDKKVKFKYGFSLEETYNEKLDTGILIIPQTEKININPFDELTIIDDNYTKKMLVGNIQRTVSKFSAPREYNYQLALISPTLLLQRVVLPNRSITQPLGENNPKKTILQIINNYIEIYQSRIPKYKLILSDTLIQKTQDIMSPELQWAQPTLYEVINDLLSYVDCMVTCTISEKTLVIDVVDFNRVPLPINESGINNEVEVINIDNYADSLEARTQNAISKRVNTYSQYVSPRSESFAILQDANFQLKLDRNIYEIKKIVAVLFHEYTKQNTQKWEVDITDKTIEKSLYDLMLPSNTKNVSGNYKRDRIYYTRGSNLIQGLDFDESSVFGFNGEMAIVNIIHTLVPETTGASGAILSNATAAQKLMFYIEYTASDDVVFHAEKNNKISYSNTLINNQDTSYIDIEAFGRKQKNLINRIGNKELVLNGRYNKIEQVPNLGDHYQDNYILTKRYMIFNPDSVNVVMNFTKDYIARDMFIGLQSEKRYTQIADASKSFASEHLNKYRFKLSKRNYMFDENSYKFASYLLHFGHKESFIKVAKVQTDESNPFALTGSAYVAGNSIVYAIGLNDNFYVGLKIEEKPKWITKDYIQTYLRYTDSLGEFKNINVKLYADYEIYKVFSEKLNPGVSYNFEKLEAARTKSHALPSLEDVEFKDEDLIFDSGDLIRYKDNREITKETFQFIINSDDDIFIKESFFTTNPFVYNGDNINFVIYTSNSETYTNATVSPLGNQTNLDFAFYNNAIYLQGENVATYAQNAKSWCIADENGNVYIAVNGNEIFLYLNKEE